MDRFSTKIKEQYGLLKSFQDQGKAGTYKIEETVDGSLPRRRQEPKQKCDKRHLHCNDGTESGSPRMVGLCGYQGS